MAWDLLPARVEAVIAERIDRLDADLREILTIASVEGELFTAQVVAEVGQHVELRGDARPVAVPQVPEGQQRGCRTEIVAEVDDAERLLANWGGGALGDSATDYYASLHRVAYYGDHTQSIRHLAHLMGLKVAEEV